MKAKKTSLKTVAKQRKSSGVANVDPVFKGKGKRSGK